jgi:hypothetical protein
MIGGAGNLPEHVTSTNHYPSPYVGLNPFTAEEAEYFCGRQDEVRLLTANILAASHLVVFGPSGVGKSSLLWAGVIPELRTDPLAIVVLIREWDDYPLTKISEVLRDEAARLLGVKFDPEVTLSDALQEIYQAGGGPIVFILDQFEAYFNLIDRTPGGEFESELGNLAALKRLDVHVVFGIRYDEIGRLDQLRRAIPDIMLATFEVSPLLKNAAREAIRGPLAAWNRSHKTDITIDDELVDALVAGCAIDRHDPCLGISAPYLQLSLERLWNKRAHPGAPLILEAYSQAGKAEGIAADHVENVLAGLESVQQRAFARMSRLLRTGSGTRMAYPAIDLAGAAAAIDLAGAAAMEEADLQPFFDDTIQPLLDDLTGAARILHVAVPHPIALRRRYEIMHDALGVPIMKWGVRVLAQARQESEQIVFETLREGVVWDRFAVGRLPELIKRFAVGALLQLLLPYDRDAVLESPQDGRPGTISEPLRQYRGPVRLKEAASKLGIGQKSLRALINPLTAPPGFLTLNGQPQKVEIGLADPSFVEACKKWLTEFESNTLLGCFVDLRTGETIELPPWGIVLGRAFQRQLSEIYISRVHLVVMNELRQRESHEPFTVAVGTDLRSLNGTTLNAAPWNYGAFKDLTSGDLVVLANVLPLLFLSSSDFMSLAGRVRLPPGIPDAHVLSEEDVSKVAGIVILGKSKNHGIVKGSGVCICSDETIVDADSCPERTGILMKLTPIKGKGIHLTFGDIVKDVHFILRNEDGYWATSVDPKINYWIRGISFKDKKEHNDEDAVDAVETVGRLQINENFFEIIAY